MKFTYEAYGDLLIQLMQKGYQFKNYYNWNETQQTVILRHDIDNNLQKAICMSEIENELMSCGGATYFVLVSTNFYNVHSKESRACMETIIKNGGSIGLHFDESQYDIQSEEELKEYVYKEANVLSALIGMKVDTVSMHRPSKKFLARDIKFENIINTYSYEYFKGMKYLSDSRKLWCENVDEIIEQNTYQRLHILIHPIWYEKNKEKSLRLTLKEAILNASLDYYDNINNNFCDLPKELTREEIENILRI